MKYAYVGCRTTEDRNARGKGLVVYEIQADGTLVHLNTIDIGGKNPVDITVDGENKHLIVLCPFTGLILSPAT